VIIAFLHSFRHAATGVSWSLVLLAVVLSMLVVAASLGWYRVHHHS
jgi:hypothetical protein